MALIGKKDHIVSIAVLCLLFSSCEIVAKAIRTDKCSHLENPEGIQNAYVVDKKLCCMCSAGEFLSQDCNESHPNSTICEPCAYNDDVKSYISFGPHMERKCTIESGLHCPKTMVLQEGSRTREASCECPTGMIKDGRFDCKKMHDTATTNPSTSESSTIRKDAISVPRTTTLHAKGTNKATKDREKKLEPVPVTFTPSNKDETTTTSAKVYTHAKTKPPDEKTTQSRIEVPDSGQENTPKPEKGPEETLIAVGTVIVIVIVLLAVVLLCKKKSIRGCSQKERSEYLEAEKGKNPTESSRTLLSKSSSGASVQYRSEIDGHTNSRQEAVETSPSQERHGHYQDTMPDSYGLHMVHGEYAQGLNEAGPISNSPDSVEPTEHGTVRETRQTRQATEQADSPIGILQGGRISDGARLNPIMQDAVEPPEQRPFVENRGARQATEAETPRFSISVERGDHVRNKSEPIHNSRQGPRQECPLEGAAPEAEPLLEPQGNNTEHQFSTELSESKIDRLSEKLKKMNRKDVKPWARKLLGADKDNEIDSICEENKGDMQEIVYRILKKAHELHGRKFTKQFIISKFREMESIMERYIDCVKNCD